MASANTPTDQLPIAERANYGPVRRLRAAARSLLLVVAFPLAYRRLVGRERRRPRRPSSPTRIGDDGTIISLDERDVVVAAVPVAEVFRVVRNRVSDPAQADELARRADEHGKLFIVLTRVIWGSELTGPVGPPASEIAGWPDYFFLEGGFITDFASIPALLRPLVAETTGSFTRAAIIHDFAYAHHPDDSAAGREACDEAMLALMADGGTGIRRRALIYLGLRLGGGPAFRSAPGRRADYQSLMREVREAEIYPFIQAQLLTFLGTELERSEDLPAGTAADIQRRLQDHAKAVAAAGGSSATREPPPPTAQSG